MRQIFSSLRRWRALGHRHKKILNTECLTSLSSKLLFSDSYSLSSFTPALSLETKTDQKLTIRTKLSQPSCFISRYIPLFLACLLFPFRTLGHLQWVTSLCQARWEVDCYQGLCIVLSRAWQAFQVFLLSRCNERRAQLSHQLSPGKLSEVRFTRIKSMSYIQLQRPPGESRFYISFLLLTKPFLHLFLPIQTVINL